MTDNDDDAPVHPPADIVVSYSSQDSDRVFAVVARLVEAGATIWIDRSGIDGALLWGEEIVEAIDACKVLLLIGSPSAFSSPNVRREVALASENNKHILPLLIEPSVIPKSMKYQLAGIQYLGLYQGDEDANFAAVCRSLARLGVSFAPTSPVEPAPEEPEPGPTTEGPVDSPGRPGVGTRRALGRSRKPAMIGGGIGVIAVLLVVALTRGGDDSPTQVAADASTTTSTPPETVGCPAADGSSAPRTSFPAPPPMCIDVARAYTATVETDVGPFTIALDAKRAPNTVNNFVFLARYHYYDNVPFHRVIPNNGLFGGGERDRGGGPGYSFFGEVSETAVYRIGSVVQFTYESGIHVVTGGMDCRDPLLPVSSYVCDQGLFSLLGVVADSMSVVQAIEADGSPDGTPKVLHRMTRVTIAET